MADPEHDDPESSRVRAYLPDLGRGSSGGRLHRSGGRVLRGARESGRRPDHHRGHDHRPRVALLRVQLPRALERRAGGGAREGCGSGSPPRLQARRAAPPRRPQGDARPQEGSGVRLRRGVVSRGAEPGSARRVPERADAEGARGARDRGAPAGVRGRGPAGRRGRPRRRRVPHVARLPAVAVPVAALQPPAAIAGEARTRTVSASRSRRSTGSAPRSATSRSSATGSTRPRSGRATSRWTTSSESSPISKRRRTSTT